MFHAEGPTFLELARQALSSTERGYDLLAPKFDRTPFRTPDSLLAAVMPHIGSVGSALDLCCGTGAAMSMLRPLCSQRLVGVDFSRGMLEEAGRRFAGSTAAGGESQPSTKVELVRADVLDLEFDAEFDVVTCFGSIGHIRRRDQPRLIANVARALRPGGRFVLVTSELPPLWSRRLVSWRLWLAIGFDAAMALRNLVWRPPFVMYYLSFLLPRARRLLVEQGFAVEVHRSVLSSGPGLHLLIAERRHAPG